MQKESAKCAISKRKLPNKVPKKKTSVGHPTDVQEKSVAVLRNSTVQYPTVPNHIINNNNNNAREEMAMPVNDTEETVPERSETANDFSETVVNAHEVDTMATGTRSVAWAEKDWGRMISPGEAEDIIAWCDEFSFRGSLDPDGVIIEALNEFGAAGSDARNTRYLAGILVKWQESGVLTVEHAKARNVEHKRKSQKEHNRNKDPGDKPTKPKSDKYERFYL